VLGKRGHAIQGKIYILVGTSARPDVVEIEDVTAVYVSSKRRIKAGVVILHGKKYR